ncbi:MAG: hypothetical protein AVDCRST_MAG59-1962, partial [uncultured Thermomicrobiales bacterium]
GDAGAGGRGHRGDCRRGAVRPDGSGDAVYRLDGPRRDRPRRQGQLLGGGQPGVRVRVGAAAGRRHGRGRPGRRLRRLLGPDGGGVQGAGGARQDARPPLRPDAGGGVCRLPDGRPPRPRLGHRQGDRATDRLRAGAQRSRPRGGPANDDLRPRRIPVPAGATGCRRSAGGGSLRGVPRANGVL